MCGQLHQTTPGSGVFSHHLSHEPPMMRLASRSIALNASGSSYSKRSASSTSTPPRRNTVVTM